MYPVSGTPRTFKFSARDMNGFRGGVSVVNWGCKISGFGGEGWRKEEEGLLKMGSSVNSLSPTLNLSYCFSAKHALGARAPQHTPASFFCDLSL